MKTLPCYKHCFVCGKENKIGLDLTFKTDGKYVIAETSLSRKYIGYENYIHGGIASTLLDEAMGWACICKGKGFYFTADLHIRYKTPIRPEQELVIKAWVSNQKGKIFFAESVILDENDNVLAKASGKFLPAKDKENKDIFEYLSHKSGKADKVTVQDLVKGG